MSTVIGHIYKEHLLYEQSLSSQQAQLRQPAVTGEGDDGTVVLLQERAVGKPLLPRSTAQISLAVKENITLDTSATSFDEH